MNTALEGNSRNGVISSLIELFIHQKNAVYILFLSDKIKTDLIKIIEFISIIYKKYFGIIRRTN